MKYPPVQYHDYLELNSLLNCQKLRSEEFQKPAHDEMLFITVHQTYELWFKQILFEIDSIAEIFKLNPLPEKMMGLAVARLDRIIEIQRLIQGQIDVMETMTPLDFLEFRDFLYPASGFQSFQWRLLETKLGLKNEFRHQFDKNPFYSALQPNQQRDIQLAMQQPSLFDLVEAWLERTPFIQESTFNFWQEYKKSVLTMLDEDESIIKENPRLTEENKQRGLEIMSQSRNTFLALFDKTAFEKLRTEGYFRLSQKAIQAALFIQIYRDQSILTLPFRLISNLQDIDERMTEWRYRHALMAHRMLGRKIGTGGSSGHEYLKTATEKNKIFTDFFNLTTFFIPRSKIPPLPQDLELKLNFQN